MAGKIAQRAGVEPKRFQTGHGDMGAFFPFAVTKGSVNFRAGSGALSVRAKGEGD
ncbi:MAG: hypothetical protein HC843_10550 [Sphingomonadales bacterium]|nr:hypothetical protein [Sphingomonadales bacterium]